MSIQRKKIYRIRQKNKKKENNESGDNIMEANKKWKKNIFSPKNSFQPLKMVSCKVSLQNMMLHKTELTSRN